MHASHVCYGCWRGGERGAARNPEKWQGTFSQHAQDSVFIAGIAPLRFLFFPFFVQILFYYGPNRNTVTDQHGWFQIRGAGQAFEDAAILGALLGNITAADEIDDAF